MSGQADGDSVKALNRQLAKLRAAAAKAKHGSSKRKHLASLERWQKIKASGVKKQCCGKKASKQCKACPRRIAELVLVPFP
ncbi:MAG: hypothetical protein ACYTF0_00675 [Planctomycetota bacterium]|jgi:hypothetical protein